MRLIINKSTAPDFNLAMEEYALTCLDMDIIMLWRNSQSVIIGRNQNAVEEIDLDYVRENGITVVRRLSGGGAVFHDLGNINFTVINALSDDDFSNYAKFTAPICDFLRTLGIDARLQGRNDLVIGDAKFSGNAQAVKNGRIMHHGTILYNADFAKLGSALKPRGVKIESKGVKSVRARVTNVAAHLENPMSVESFFERLAGYFRENVEGIEEYTLTEADIAATDRLVREKYASWDWNFGKSPAYNYEKSVKFPFGLVELRLSATGGIIESVRVFGDFFGVGDISVLENALTGARHERAALALALESLDIAEYIHGITTDEFLGLF